MNKILVLFGILLFTQCNASAQKINSINQADALITAFVADQKIPGLAATVYQKGEIVWSKGYGYADLEHLVKVDPSKTKFRIGSVSKTLTASALGRLMDTKDVDLDAPIQKYVPDFPKKKYDLSMRQLGGHIAGIRHYKGGEFMSTKHYPTVADGLSIFDESPLLFEPGTDYQYSSYGWNLLSAGIEGISGETFLDYIYREVFEELELDNTLAEYPDAIIDHRTSYYINKREGTVNAPFVDNSYKWAGGGFLSTAHDMIKYGIAHMEPGYLSAETLAELQSPQNLTSCLLYTSDAADD